ncbi:MAG: hypothetical protein AAF597_05335 [Bacteroidota bacterium]
MFSRRRQGLIAVFTAAVLLLNAPLLFLPERWGNGSSPWLLVYLVVVWLGVIIATALLLQRNERV